MDGEVQAHPLFRQPPIIVLGGTLLPGVAMNMSCCHPFVITFAVNCYSALRVGSKTEYCFVDRLEKLQTKLLVN